VSVVQTCALPISHTHTHTHTHTHIYTHTYTHQHSQPGSLLSPSSSLSLSPCCLSLSLSPCSLPAVSLLSLSPSRCLARPLSGEQEQEVAGVVHAPQCG